MYTLPVLAAVAILLGFGFGYKQANIMAVMLMMAAFVAIGFGGFAVSLWELPHGLKMIFVSCVLGQTSYMLGITFSKGL